MFSVGRQDTKFVKNFVTLKSNVDPSARKLHELAELMVRSWDPDWAHISGAEVFVASGGKPVLDRLLYVKDDVGVSYLAENSGCVEKDGGSYHVRRGAR